LNRFENFQIDLIPILIILVVVIGIGSSLIPAIPLNLTPTLIAVNLIVIIFYYFQWRNTSRPVLSISLIGFDRYGGFDPRKIPEPFILEECHNGAYILLSNNSSNIASEITVEFSITFKEVHLSEKRILSYLNPHETARILVPFDKIVEIYRDQFTTVEEGSGILTLPKDTLYIDMVVKVTFGHIPRYSMKDTYRIEWVGSNHSPKPLNQIFSWNMRDDLPIYKRKTE
jgi:hypothetical protein